MEKYQQKLSLLQDLIALSLADGNESFLEGNFIHTVATSLGISESEVSQLKENPIQYHPEDKETDRIIQFYRLLLLMGIDQNKTDAEILFCKETALKMGLNPLAASRTIEKMLAAETGMLSPEEVIQLFQVQHN